MVCGEVSLGRRSALRIAAVLDMNVPRVGLVNGPLLHHGLTMAKPSSPIPTKCLRESEHPVSAPGITAPHLAAVNLSTAVACTAGSIAAAELQVNAVLQWQTRGSRRVFSLVWLLPIPTMMSGALGATNFQVVILAMKRGGVWAAHWALAQHALGVTDVFARASACLPSPSPMGKM